MKGASDGSPHKTRPVAYGLAMTGPAHFILYVADQERSTSFWTAVLERQPSLNVPGMTEFPLAQGAVLGLMPEAGIRRLLGARIPDPSAARGTPRSEVYLVVSDPAAYHRRALANGAVELSELLLRSWGHTVAYSLDPDGHVIAFAGAPVEHTTS
jgi:uncharacterized protein